MITIGIKALNEERHIAAALASARAALAALPGGMTGAVVLADSCSADRTVAIAQGVPGVRIVQLAHAAERCCGAGAQLAFQAAAGDYFYLLDGDMELDPGFLPAGIAFLEANPGHAGVAGRVTEMNVAGIEFELRQHESNNTVAAAGEDVTRLDCGGLYRVAAVRQVGWFGDRNLHSFEEFDLGARLRAAGWRLARIDVPAVAHHGHTLPALPLMWRRLRTGYAGGAGEVVRGAIGRAHIRLVLSDFVQLRYAVVVMGWWAMLLACLLAGAPGLFAGLLALPFAFLTWRRGGWRLGAYSMAVWNFQTVGFLMGIVRARVNPAQPLEMIDCSNPGTPAAPHNT